MPRYEVLNADFEHVAFIDNDLEYGINFSNDTIETTIEGGVCAITMDVHKDEGGQHEHVREGNFIGFKSHAGTSVLASIMEVDEGRDIKRIHCEDASLTLINKVLVEEETEEQPARTLKSYIDDTIRDTGWRIGKNESSGSKSLELGRSETAIKRIRDISEAFGVEFYFESKRKKNGEIDFTVNFVKNRGESEERTFRYSTDDLVDDMSRKVNISNLVTKLHLYGKPQEKEKSSATTSGGGGEVQTDSLAQPNAKKFDGSKAGQASSPISTSGWNRAWLARMRIDAADPPHVTGAYIDSFLRRGYSDSPLIGYGQTIKDLADYYGISVGMFLGAAGKETTFGRNSCGGRYNFTCIMGGGSTIFSGKIPHIWTRDRNWINPSSVKSGIAAFFQLARAYVDGGHATFERYLNRWSPPFENNQDTFYNLYWGVMKSFGYDTSDTVRKRNYSKKSDNPETVNPKRGTAQTAPTGGGKSEHDKMLDKMIEWFQQRKGRVSYSMAARNGPNSYDCSSAVYSALLYAGFKTAIGNRLGSTVSLWYDVGASKLMQQIPMSQARRGDILLSGAKYEAGAGAAAHTGVFLNNSRIIHCTASSCGRGIIETGLNCGGSPQYAFRINVQRHGGGDSSGGGIDSRIEKAVTYALSRVGRTPYVWGGQTASGWDCSGMIYAIFRHAGFTNVTRTTASGIMHSSAFRKVSRAEARRGDVAVTNGGGHVELLLQAPSQGIHILHAANEALGTMTQRNHVGGVLGYYRVRG